MRGVLVRSMGAASAAGALALGVLAVAHCAAFSADPGVDPAPPVDGSALTDASFTDAALTDAPDGGDEAGSSFGAFGGCATVLSDGFERTPFPAAVWGAGLQKSPDGAAALDTTAPYEGAKSLRFDVSGAAPVAYLQSSLPKRTRVRYAFAAKFDALSARTINVNSLEFNSQKLAVYFGVDMDGFRFRQQDFGTSGNPSTTQPLGPALTDWHTYELTLDLADGAKGHARVDIDGHLQNEFDLYFPLQPGALDVRAGVVYAESGTTTSRIWLDDIVVCAEP